MTFDGYPLLQSVTKSNSISQKSQVRNTIDFSVIYYATICQLNIMLLVLFEC